MSQKLLTVLEINRKGTKYKKKMRFVRMKSERDQISLTTTTTAKK